MPRHLAYPGSLFAVVVAASLLVPHHNEAVVAFAVLAPLLAALTLMERVAPHRPDWTPSQRVWGLDVFYTLVSSQGVARLTKLALVAGLAAAAGHIQWGGLWPGGWPLPLQVVLAVLLADLSLYVAHRWMHGTNLGWRVHLVHHSPTGLHVFASARSHPLNVALKLVCETGVLLLLGAPADVVTVWLCWMTANGLLQHANVSMPVGPLRFLLASPAVHRAHHDADGVPCNFGSTTTVWDHLGGTFRDPARAPVAEVGIAGSVVPERYLNHLVAPFLPLERQP